MYLVRVEAWFAAAHFLKHYQGKCERLHGHNYKVRAWAKGPSLRPGGMLLDFGELVCHVQHAEERGRPERGEDSRVRIQGPRPAPARGAPAGGRGVRDRDEHGSL